MGFDEGEILSGLGVTGEPKGDSHRLGLAGLQGEGLGIKAEPVLVGSPLFLVLKVGDHNFVSACYVTGIYDAQGGQAVTVARGQIRINGYFAEVHPYALLGGGRGCPGEQRQGQQDKKPHGSGGHCYPVHGATATMVTTALN